MKSQNKATGFFNSAYKLSELIVVIFFILLCLSVTVQVTARYFFNHSFGWGEELPLILFLWVSFLAAAVAYRDGSHLSVDFIVDKFPQKVRYAIFYINLILSLGFVLTVLYYESIMVKFTNQSTFVVLKISKAYCYVGIPVSCALFALFIIERLMTKPKLLEKDKIDMPNPNPL